MADLNLEDAARFIGVPAQLLHNAAWAGTGPEQVGKSYWAPRFTEQSLRAWLASVRTNVSSDPLNDSVIPPGGKQIHSSR